MRDISTCCDIGSTLAMSMRASISTAPAAARPSQLLAPSVRKRFFHTEPRTLPTDCVSVVVRTSSLPATAGGLAPSWWATRC